MNTTPLISIVMPVYNASLYLPSSLASVLSQSETSWELIVVDDASQDDSVSVLEAIKDPRLKIIQQKENMGPGAARQTGIDTACGHYIAFIDADDIWHPEKLMRQLAFMKASSADFSFTSYVRWNVQTGAQSIFGVPEQVTYGDLLKTNYIGCSTVMLVRHRLEHTRMQNVRSEDFALWLLLLRNTVPRAYGMPEALTLYRHGHPSLSSAKTMSAYGTWRVYRDILELSLLEAHYSFFHYALRGVLRHRLQNLARALGVLHSGTHVEGWPKPLHI